VKGIGCDSFITLLTKIVCVYSHISPFLWHEPEVMDLKIIAHIATTTLNIKNKQHSFAADLFSFIRQITYRFP
jgi:hypothetical protein